MTDLREWYASRVQQIELPSGLTAVVRKVGVLDLIAQSEGEPVPQTLRIAETVTKLTRSGQQLSEKMPSTRMIELMPVLNMLVRSALVSPKIGDETDLDNGVLAINELPFRDKIAVFKWCNEEAAQLAGFHDEEE